VLHCYGLSDKWFNMAPYNSIIIIIPHVVLHIFSSILLLISRLPKWDPSLVTYL
jgi:hypothetical protein